MPTELRVALAQRAKVATRWATEHDGLVSAAELRGFGWSPAAIRRAVAKGWLIPVHRGVYAVGHRPRTHRAQWRAAVLACGDGSALSHGSAAAVHGLLRPYHRVHVTAPTTRRHAGIATHTADVEVVKVAGLPCTTVSRTLCDLAGSVPHRVLESAVRQAEHRRLLDLSSLDAPFRGKAGA